MNQQNQPTYSFNEKIVQGIVSLLGEMPARVSRDLLNAIESEIRRQDEERERQTGQALRSQITSEIRAELTNQADSVQRPQKEAA